MHYALIVVMLAGGLLAEDPAMVRRDGKDSAAVQKLIVEQAIAQAKIELILGRYVVTHNCPTGRAGMSPAGIRCETTPPPAPVPPPAQPAPPASAPPATKESAR